MAREEKIGNPYKELILRTSGTIKVLVGDKYYTLNYKEEEEESKDDSEENSINNWAILASDGIEEYINGSIPYPGDNTIIFVPGDQIYYTINGGYFAFTGTPSSEPIVQKNSQTSFDDTVVFNGSIPFIISNSTNVIKNLNSQYLNGYLSSDFIKKTDTAIFESIQTADELCSIKDGNLHIPKITSDTISTNTLSANNITSGLTIGNIVAVSNVIDHEEGKYVNNTVNLLSKLYSLYLNEGINTDLSFLDLAKSLLTIVNSDYNWTPIPDNYINQILSSGMLFKVQNINLWKTITIKNSNETLYDKILKYENIEEIDESFNGVLFSATITSGDINLNDTIYFNIEESITRSIDTGYKGIITYKNDNYIEFKSNYKTQSWINSTLKSKTVNIVNDLGENILSFTVDYYLYPDIIKSIIPTLSITNGIIGNINNITDEVFGDLTGYGLYSKRNCTLINPNIAINTNIKLSKNDSYIGQVNGSKWITISNDKCIIKTSGYELDSDGYIKTKSFTVNPDGTLTIGNITGTLQVSEDGTIKLI